jgi:hypothetical protein
MFVCILGLLAVSLWSTSAFAQGTLTVSSVPRTTAISTGHTEIAGDILVNLVAPVGGFGAGSSTLTVDYGVPITVPAAGFIIVCGAGTLAGGGAACPGGTQYTASGSGTSGTFQIGGSNQNQLLISLFGLPAAAGGGTISISGVKVSLAAFAGTKLTATLATSAPPLGGGPYTIAAGQNSTDVITTIAPAFTTATATGGTATPVAGQGRGTILTTTTVSDRSFNIDIPENFVDAFKATLGVSGYLNDPSLTFTFSGIPAGVFLNLAGGTIASGGSNTACTAQATDGSQFYNTITGATTVIPVGNLTNLVVSQANPTTVLNFTGLTFNQTQTEAIRLRGCVYTSGVTAPLAPGTIAATVTLSPNGVALNSGVQIPPVAGNFPRYQVSTVSVNVVDIVLAETQMLLSFAVRNTAGFDTGIAVANTSTDPFGSNGATPNDGTISLTFYPQGTGSSFTYTTTAGSPGQGLSSTGALASGKTWSVGLSELLGAISGAPASFTGYVIVRANFTHGHGAAYITDYRGFTSFTPFLIIVPGRSLTEGLNN